MQNHLFIGLGGQGGKSIAELQKVFAARSTDAASLRNNGQRWEFLYIDSSRDVTNERKNWVHFGKNLQLPPSSFLYLKDDGQSINARSMSQNPDVAPWIGNVEKLQKFLEGVQGIQGANQRRRLGRLLFARNADRIRKAICEDKITPMLSTSNQCAIHVFASLAGGTGSGGIVDLVTMLRTNFPNASAEGGFPVFLYLYVTDRKFEEAQVGYFHQNQSAALRDLNALCCGKLKPTLLGSASGANQFSGDEPITQILLSSQLSSGGQMLELSQQHQIVAEAAFERIYSYVSGHLDSTQQKSITGEDKLASYPGEPLGNILRTFRFGSVGMRRWEVPIEEVRELLARDLYVSIYRRLLFQNWNPSLGFLGQKLRSHIPGYSKNSSNIVAVIDAERLANSKITYLIQKLNSDFNNFHAGKNRDGFKNLDLEAYEGELRERYSTALDNRGVHAVFKDFESDRKIRLENIKNGIHSIVRQAWTGHDQALGLAYVHDLLIEIQGLIRQDLAKDTSSQTDNSALQRRMDRRKAEWLKMTWLSRPFKQQQLALAHLSDLTSVLRQDIRSRVDLEDREMLQAVMSVIGAIASEYQLASGKLEEWCEEAEKRKNELHHDLTSLRQDRGNVHEGVVANKAELSLTNLEAHLKDQRLESTLLGNACAELIDKALLDTMGGEQLTKLGRLSDDQKVQYRESADTIIFKRVEQIHETIKDRTGRDSVLSGSVLDIVEQRHKDGPEQFQNELLAFINSSTCNIALAKGEMQPRQIRGDSNMPSMPRSSLIVGLPKNHSFGPMLAKMIKPLLEAGNTAIQGVYYHEDPTQIRMLSVTFWMAARFASVVQKLEAMYVEALANDSAGDTAYFTNIDPSGEMGKRPPLLLPSAEESQGNMRAALWLGTKIHGLNNSGMLIQESNNQVVLIQQTEHGISPLMIGESIDALNAAASIVTIHLLNDAVTTAVSTLPPVRIEELRAKVTEEDSVRLRKDGAASQEYITWVKDREKIHQILNK